MTTYTGEFNFRVFGCDSDDMFEEHLDQVLAFLLDDVRVIDPDYTASLKHRTVLFSVCVESDDQAQGFGVLNGALRSAIHAAEGGTSGWESRFADSGAKIRPSVSVDA